MHPLFLHIAMPSAGGLSGGPKFSRFHAPMHCCCLVVPFSDKHSAPHLNAHLEQMPPCRLCNICKGQSLHLDVLVRVTQYTEQMQVVCQHSASVSELITEPPGSEENHGARKLRCLTRALINYRLGNERDVKTKSSCRPLLH